MPAVFNIAALKLPLVQLIGLPQAARNAAQKVPPGQAPQSAAQGAPSGAAPNGAGAPMATGAVLPPSAQLPVPAPPPVVSTSQTGRLAAAAINGLDRRPEDRQGRGGQGDRRRRDPPSEQAPGQAPDQTPEQTPEQAALNGPAPPQGLPGGPAPACSALQRAAPAYAAARSVTGPDGAE
ncbi:hypothetical protein PVW46_26340 [Mameliella sp. AT18]|nr:hypothetical protein [Mameliella sp. AT18]MDD9733438.1 hypothetical protein [Mameliella sp. AT18]ODM47795.1 hypothetical protein A9320_21745 [Ruegeria sp. PBVC088]